MSYCCIFAFFVVSLQPNMKHMIQALQQRQQDYIEALLAGDTERCQQLGPQFQQLGRMLTDELIERVEANMRSRETDFVAWPLGLAQRDERLAIEVMEGEQSVERISILGVQHQRGQLCWLTNSPVALPVSFGPELHPLVIRPGHEQRHYLYHTGTLLAALPALLPLLGIE